MFTGVAYARYSSNNQRDESIDAQLRAIRLYCEANNINLIEIYTDEALTGKNDKREDFQRMIFEIERGIINVDYIFVHKFNRFARNKFDSAVYKRKMREKGVRVISVTQKIDDTPEGEMLEGFLEVLDEYYSANLSIEVKKGIRENLLQGRPVGGKIILGYDFIKGEFKINENDAEIVRRIFTEYASGVPRSQICDKLNKEGLRNRNGNLFVLRTVADMLRNEKYIGIYRYKLSDKEVIVDKNIIPPIIDYDLWERVQAAHKEPVKKRPNGTNVYYLTGKLVCGYCGHSFSGSGGGKKLKNGDTLYYYKCVGKTSHKNGCISVGTNKRHLEEAVTRAAIEKIMSKQSIANISSLIYKQISQTVNKSAKNVRSLQADLKKLDEEYGRLARLYITGKIPEKHLDIEKENILSRQHSIQNDLNLLDMSTSGNLEITENEVAEMLVDYFERIVSSKKQPEKLIQAIVGSYVEKVEIFNENIQIYLKLDFPTIVLNGSDNEKFGGAIHTLSPLNYEVLLSKKDLKLHSISNIITIK